MTAEHHVLPANQSRYIISVVTYFLFCVDPFPNCQEELGWEEFEGRCYKAFTNPLAWSGAEASCVAEGSHLVAITSQTEQLYVAGKVNELNRHMWIGLSSVVSYLFKSVFLI